MSQASSADIGVTGLAVMGRNLARNLALLGYHDGHWHLLGDRNGNLPRDILGNWPLA